MAPLVIQGGMGIGISLAPLARAVAGAGQVGVVSGTALDHVAARRLQDGDPGGGLRRAFRAFPDAAMAQRVLSRYYRPEGRRPYQPYRPVPKWTIPLDPARCDLAITAAFAEIWLAKEGHGGRVGLNLMEKLALANLPCLYGALLAGIDYLLIGAGIPAQYPRLLDCLVRHEAATLSLPVSSLDPAGSAPAVEVRFDPQLVQGDRPPVLPRPQFFPIISSDTLAAHLVKRGGIDGFVVEGPTAGGHNAPPRGRPAHFNERGEPIYGAKDVPNLDRIFDYGMPVYLAGGCGHPESLQAAVAKGAAGVQVGTPFALCVESGLDPGLRAAVLDQVRRRALGVHNSADASPCGLPFHVVQVAGSVSEDAVYESRLRKCDVGLLAEPCLTAGGEIIYRCPAEPVERYVARGGDRPDTEGRRCLCNGLLATAGRPQQRHGGRTEPPIVTLGEDFRAVEHFVDRGQVPFSARDVLDFILEGAPGVPAEPAEDRALQLA